MSHLLYRDNVRLLVRFFGPAPANDPLASADACLHYLLSSAFGKDECDQRFTGCWPILDASDARTFRNRVSQWCMDLKRDGILPAWLLLRRSLFDEPLGANGRLTAVLSALAFHALATKASNMQLTSAVESVSDESRDLSEACVAQLLDTCRHTETAFASDRIQLDRMIGTLEEEIAVIQQTLQSGSHYDSPAKDLDDIAVDWSVVETFPLCAKDAEAKPAHWTLPLDTLQTLNAELRSLGTLEECGKMQLLAETVMLQHDTLRARLSHLRPRLLQLIAEHGRSLPAPDSFPTAGTSQDNESRVRDSALYDDIRNHLRITLQQS